MSITNYYLKICIHRINQYLCIKERHMTKINLKTAVIDFEWVVKVLESSSDESQLETSLKCFNLWCSKHIDSSLTKTEKNTVLKLSDNFWKMYKEKNSKIGTINI